MNLEENEVWFNEKYLVGKASLPLVTLQQLFSSQGTSSSNRFQEFHEQIVSRLERLNEIEQETHGEFEQFVKEIILLLGRIGFALDSKKPGLFNDYIEKLRHCYKSRIPTHLSHILKGLEIEDNEVALDAKEKSQEEDKLVVEKKTQNKQEEQNKQLLMKFKQRPKVLSQFSRGLADPEKFFRQTAIQTVQQQQSLQQQQKHQLNPKPTAKSNKRKRAW